MLQCTTAVSDGFAADTSRPKLLLVLSVSLFQASLGLHDMDALLLDWDWQQKDLACVHWSC